MGALSGPVAAAAVLLVVGGAPKMWSPHDTARALRGLRLPATPPAVRLVGAAELTSGLALLAAPGRGTALLVAGWYAAFTAVVALALRSARPLATCGCFGRAETRPSVPHLVLVAAASATCLAFAARPAPLLDGHPGIAVAFAGYVALTAWFGYLAMSRLAALR